MLDVVLATSQHSFPPVEVVTTASGSFDPGLLVVRRAAAGIQQRDGAGPSGLGCWRSLALTDEMDTRVLMEVERKFIHYFAHY